MNVKYAYIHVCIHVFDTHIHVNIIFSDFLQRLIYSFESYIFFIFFHLFLLVGG